MRLGEILVGRGLITLKDLYASLETQKLHGGRLGEILVAAGLLTIDQAVAALTSVAQATPAMPRSIGDTGIPNGRLFNLMIRLMHFQSRQSVSDLARAMKLPYAIVRLLMDEATQRNAVQPLGTGGGVFAEIHYALSTEGRKILAEACEQTLYVGPAPVPLDAYRNQVEKQRVNNETITLEHLRQRLLDLALPERYIRKLLPAINTGRSVLMFGPPGNGKTTIASRFAALLDHVVYIPYAVEVDGEVIKIFDAGLHRSAVSAEDRAAIDQMESMAEAYDDRWVACRRPFAIVGGELTLEMLELRYDPKSKIYDAPQHVKALNGVFLIDDFGRQQIKPTELLNRWIVPMENRVDYLRLQTGYVFSLPFDALLVFSTNIDPQDVMDAAQLRRIPYKIKINGPDVAEYRVAFAKQAAAYQLEMADDVFDYVVDVLSVSGKFGLALFQPKFICEQVSEVCKAFDLPRTLTIELATEALSNLYVQIDTKADKR
jgi:MoxR-like ATPase